MKRKYHVEFYEDRRGQFRWSLRNLNNHKIMADGAEGFATESNARRSARRVGMALLISSFRRVTRDIQNGDYKRA